MSERTGRNPAAPQPPWLRCAGLAAAVLVLAGCARDSAREMEAKLNPLVGRPTGDVAIALGMPDRVTVLDGAPPGRADLHYRLIWPLLVGRQQAMPVGAENPYALVCDIVFHAAEARVAGYSYEGPVCGWGGLPDMAPMVPPQGRAS